MLRFVMVSALILTAATGARAETFPFDASAYQQKINAQLKGDEADQIDRCVKSGTGLICSFEHERFDKSASALKTLNLINGRFSDKARLLIFVEKGQVARLVVGGDRADPANLFRVIGLAGSVLRSLGLNEDQTTKELKELGLMRGDSDANIGKPVTDIMDSFAVTCNNQASVKTTAFGCVFEPRS